MRNQGRRNIISALLIAVMAFSIIPFSAFHHHEHREVCDVASSIPTEFKREKDKAHQHFHTYEKNCFVCSVGLTQNYLHDEFPPLKRSDIVYHFETPYYESCTVAVFSHTRNKAPPARA